MQFEPVTSRLEQTANTNKLVKKKITIFTTWTVPTYKHTRHETITTMNTKRTKESEREMVVNIFNIYLIHFPIITHNCLELEPIYFYNKSTISRFFPKEVTYGWLCIKLHHHCMVISSNILVPMYIKIRIGHANIEQLQEFLFVTKCMSIAI